jgi:AcrR family transcriptional regulator
MNRRLGFKDWIDEGLRTLARSGIDAVRVEPLAKALKVTKGSFYWHFDDRAALLSVMLEVWEARATEAVIDEVERRGGDERERLETLFRIVSATDGRLERAIRAWAGYDEAARLVLDRVDQHRQRYLEDLFLALGFSGPEAAARARFCYHAVIGQFALDTQMSAEERIAERVGIMLPALIRR